MVDSESQILQPLVDSVSTSVTRPIKADFPIRVGYRLEASSRMLWKSESKVDVNADTDGCLDGVFVFEGISSFECNARNQKINNLSRLFYMKFKI